MENFRYFFHQGTSFNAYEKMGAHFVTEDGKNGVRFTVWAPGAQNVSVIGDFNGWESDKAPMEKVSDEGLYSLFIPGIENYEAYKYSILSAEGKRLEKADPFAFHSETRPANASKVYDISGYEWGDGRWLERRKNTDIYTSPVLIYEAHLGSWKRKEDGSFLNYREAADEMIPYVKKLGFTHIELLPLSEHPLDESWGYQITGYYSVTSRMGTPKDFMYFVDMCHRNGLGVIMDWVPSHFPKDGHGLYRFDGSPCYEYKDPKKGEHREWGTAVFDYGRPEVQSFLISNAVFWLEVFHVDGLRVDAVASMLYLDYGRNEGEWLPNSFGGKENLEAIAFLRKLNTEVFARFPDVIMAAEESTAWPMVTAPASDGGLGFNFKWNMGWMNDVLSYIETDPLFRQYCHDKITFPMCYAYSENFILPISHDEVVHGKKSLLDKMPGSYEEKFAGMRTFLAFMAGMPGKKLLFMGCEFGQFAEWNFSRGIETELMEYESHRTLFEYVQALNMFYLDNPPLWEDDLSWDGFRWSCADDKNNNIAAFIRIAPDDEMILCIYNFAPVRREDYSLGLPEGRWEIVFSSDSPEFGGTGLCTDRVETFRKHFNGYEDCGIFDIPPHSALFYRKV